MGSRGLKKVPKTKQKCSKSQPFSMFVTFLMLSWLLWKNITFCVYKILIFYCCKPRCSKIFPEFGGSVTSPPLRMAIITHGRRQKRKSLLQRIIRHCTMHMQQQPFGLQIHSKFQSNLLADEHQILTQRYFMVCTNEFKSRCVDCQPGQWNRKRKDCHNIMLNRLVVQCTGRKQHCLSNVSAQQLYHLIRLRHIASTATLTNRFCVHFCKFQLNMSNISAAETTDWLIPVYSDVGHHAKESKYICATIEIPHLC